jgi:hypothetical protein
MGSSGDVPASLTRLSSILAKDLRILLTLNKRNTSYNAYAEKFKSLGEPSVPVF